MKDITNHALKPHVHQVALHVCVAVLKHFFVKCSVLIG